MSRGQNANSMSRTLGANMMDPLMNRQRVLVASQSTELAELLRDVLEYWGAVVVSAVSGADALATMMETELSLAVVEDHLPDTCGQELIMEMEERLAALPATVLLSSHARLSWWVAPDGERVHPEIVPMPFNLCHLREACWRALLRRLSGRPSEEGSRLREMTFRTSQWLHRRPRAS